MDKSTGITVIMQYQRHRRTLLIFLVVMLLTAAISACTGRPPKGEPVSPVDGVFRIDASGIGKGEVRFFSYEVGGKPVTFMVARTASGELKTAFDACVTCYPHRKGYRCETGRVVCVHCATVFELEELGAGKGNCVPLKVAHRLEGGSVVIDESEIESGAKWF